MHVLDTMTWEMFDQIFQDKYFPESVKDRMSVDFLSLKHVTEYELKFDE